MPTVRLSLKQLMAGLAAAFGLLMALDLALPPPLQRAGVQSVMVSDRQGRPLRAFPTDDGRWRFAAHLEDIDPVFIKALLRVEDKHFYTHRGTDWSALFRAAYSSFRAGHIVSGGSTITMQTARMLEPRERNFRSKFIEILRARQIERRLSKTEILELYLTLAPYGGNLEGIRAASWSYFGHEPDQLSDDQIALLIALPQSPEVRRPDRRPKSAKAARRVIAAKLEAYGFLSAQRAQEAQTADLPLKRYNFPAKAWHASAKARAGAEGDVRSSLDAALQAEIEAIAHRQAAMAGEKVQIAALVIDIPTRAVRAAIGSAARDRPGGWMDLTAQARSPGSTLKPFIYAMAFDDGTAAPDTRIMDLPRRFASYQPQNFDHSFRGDVLVSEALQHSLNVPAVLMLDRVGPERFASQLTLAGAHPRTGAEAEQKPGLALALGGAGLTARELALLYAALGDEGLAKPLVWRAEDEGLAAELPGRRLMSGASAQKILKILREAPMPKGRMPGRLTAGAPQVAFKTGTSYGYRDAWAAGVVGDIAIIVWVGRADGAPRPGKTGRASALPVLFEIADRSAFHLGGQGGAEARLSSQRFVKPPRAMTDFSATNAPPEILFPPRGAELWAGRVDGKPARAFVLAGRGEGDLHWYVDGDLCQLDDAGLPVWQPSRAGFYTVSAVDSRGRSSRVRVRVLTSRPS